jgi:membrane fusion protein, multidrug efflux system
MKKALVIGVVLLAACTQAAEQAAEEVRPVRVMTIGVAESSRRVEYAGEVRARYETRLAFRVGGKITERLVDTGATVRRGQAVARIDAADLTLAQAQAASLEAEHSLAEAEYKRYRELREKNFISQAEFDRRANTLSTAESKLAAARAQHRQTANQAGYATLVADTAGVITAIEAEAGQVVAAGQTVARLARPGEREVVFSIPESQRDFLEGEKQISVTLNARPGKSWKGRLRELSPTADPATRTYAARVTILGAGDDVDLGMSARAVVEAAGSRAKRIEVPIAALHSRGESAHVFLVGADGTVRPQEVKTAGVTGERVVIEAGLKPGDVVVAAGANLLRSGQRVRVLAEK